MNLRARSIVTLGVVLTAAACGGAAGKMVQAPISFDPVAGKSVIFVYRDGGMAGRTDNKDKTTIKLDARAVGRTENVTALRLVVDPGHHVVQTRKAKAELDTEAGKVYYVHEELSMGLLGSSVDLAVVDEAKGHKGTDGCILLKSSLDGAEVKAEGE